MKTKLPKPNRSALRSTEHRKSLPRSKSKKSVPRFPDSTWRHNGNVARLPKDVRDKINSMIQDGLTYPAIIQNLGEQGKHLNVVNLSRWKKGGYMDWLAEQAFIERTRARQETPAQLVRDFDATDINHAALQLGTLHIFEALRDLGPGSLNKKLGGDCASFARLLNALARASRETMQLQKYREACAKARAALQELKDPKRKLTDSERRAIVRNVDQILGLGSEDDEPPAEPTNSNGNQLVPAAPANETSFNGASQPLIPQSSIANIANCQS